MAFWTKGSTVDPSLPDPFRSREPGDGREPEECTEPEDGLAADPGLFVRNQEGLYARRSIYIRYASRTVHKIGSNISSIWCYVGKNK